MRVRRTRVRGVHKYARGARIRMGHARCVGRGRGHTYIRGMHLRSNKETRIGQQQSKRNRRITLMLIIVMTITLITLTIRVIGAPLVATTLLWIYICRTACECL